jgi:hypothetical protein
MLDIVLAYQHSEFTTDNIYIVIYAIDNKGILIYNNSILILCDGLRLECRQRFYLN